RRPITAGDVGRALARRAEARPTLLSEERGDVDSNALERIERPDVRPSEIAEERADVLRFFHQRIVDGDRRHVLVIARRDGSDLRLNTLQFAAEDTRTPDEDAGVPRVVSGAQKLDRALTRRLFREAVDANHARRDL